MASVWLFAGGSASLMMAANPSNSILRRRTMSTKKATKKHAPKAKRTSKGTKTVSAKKSKPAGNGKTKLSALDAAAQVLAASKEPLNAKQMIDAMAAKGLWTSPGGKTPHATLYSAILREVGTKGKDARFKKTDRGHFASNG
jgi:hypothetical protein